MCGRVHVSKIIDIYNGVTTVCTCLYISLGSRPPPLRVFNFAEVEHLKSGKAWAQTSCEVDVW